MKQRTRLLAILAEFSVVFLATTSCWTLPSMAQTGDGGVQGKPTSTDASQETRRENSPPQLDLAKLTDAIANLASAKFRERQAAHQVLVAAGSQAVAPLEKKAKTRQLESATRAVEILTEIAREPKTRDVAMAALERLAKEPTNRIAEPAARAVKDLNTTDEERAIDALAADGVRMYRSSNGGVYSVTLVNDGQIALLKYFTKLRSVRIRGQEVTDDGITHLADVKGLSNLTISRSSVTDVGLHRLRALASLDRLSLSGGSFSSEGLRQLKHVPKLRNLSLSIPIDKSDVAFLTDLSQIESLHLSQLRLSQLGVDIINQLDNLKQLTLSMSDVDDESLRWIGQLDVELNLSVVSSKRITDDGWKHLEGKRLRTLSLMHTVITDHGLAHIGKIPLLHSLMIFTAPITDAGLEHLRELKSLRSLSLRDTKVTEEGVNRLRKAIPNVRLFGFAAPAIRAPPRVRERKQIHFLVTPKTGKKSAHIRGRLTAELVEQLKKEPNVDSIFLTDGQTKDVDLLLLAKVPMKGLVISSIHVTDRGLKALEDHPTLESLALWSSSITDRALESITRIPSLTKLKIDKAPITDEGMRGLIDRLSDAGQIKTLSFFKCQNITNGGLKQIGQLTSLEQLFLNNNDELTSGLLAEIVHLKNLNRLELDSIAIDEADLVHLAALTKLETLGLSCSHSKAKLTDRGLTYVSQLPSLQSLTIQDAEITDAGVSSLIQLQGIQRLGLARTRITDQGIAAIAKGFPKLLHLGLSGTQVTDAGMVHVGKLTMLESLMLDKTQTGDAGIRHLDQLKKLQFIYLNRSKVSDEAHQRFQRIHPNTRILMDPR